MITRTTSKKPKEQFILRNDGSFLTPEFRVSFPYVLKKDKNEKYGLGMLFAKDRVDFSNLLESIEEEINARWPKKRPSGLLHPVLDGDEANRVEYKGHYYINGKCGIYRPSIVASDKVTAITEPEDFYGGCWARAVINLYTWEHPAGKKGVSVSVRSLMKVRDDEPFVGRVSAVDDFEGVETDSSDV